MTATLKMHVSDLECAAQERLKKGLTFNIGRKHIVVTSDPDYWSVDGCIYPNVRFTATVNGHPARIGIGQTLVSWDDLEIHTGIIMTTRDRFLEAVVSGPVPS